MLIFMLHLNNGIIKYNPEKERLFGRYNTGIIVALANKVCHRLNTFFIDLGCAPSKYEDNVSKLR